MEIPAKVDVLGVKVCAVTMNEAVQYAEYLLREKRKSVVFTPNPEMVSYAQKDRGFLGILNSADMLLADGIGVVIASRMLGAPLPERVAGYDFIHHLFDKPYSFYLFGAKPGIADMAAEKLRQRFSGINIVGTADGYFKDDKPIIVDINQTRPDVLIVCLGSPRQERWIAKNLSNLDIGFAIALGGTLDGIAGNVKRAPVWMQRCGLEWFYRVLKQPSRLPRLLSIVAFLLKVLFKRK